MLPNPRFGGSTFPFMWQESALESMRRLKRLGLGAVDILLAPGHLWPDADGDRSAKDIKKAMDDEGLTIDSLSLPALDFNLASCLPEVRSLSIENYCRAIELSASLGGRGVGVVPGRISALLPPSRAESLGWLGDSLAILDSYASAHDVCLFVETHPHTPVPTCEELVSLLEALNCDQVKIAYDIATAIFINEDYVDMIARHCGWIGQIHLSDSSRARWEHAPLGRGDLDVTLAVEAIRNVGFSGVTILEIITDDAEVAIKESISLLTALGALGSK